MPPTAHRFDPAILREYDIRGTVGKSLTVADAFVLGRAFATLAAERVRPSPVVAVGRDGRLSSPELEASLVEGLRVSGARVRRIGVGPTAMLYFATKTLPADAGVMVTGSHNPADHNGFKMVMGDKPFFGADVKALGAAAARGDFVEAEGDLVELCVIDDYVARLLSGLRPARALTVVWDPGNGAAGEIVVELAQRLPGRHVVLNAAIDGTFPAHHPDPMNPANLTQLIEAVGRHGADLGFAFDGDGDRLGVIDTTGRILATEQVMMLLAEEVLESRPGAPILADVKASQSLLDRIAALGGRPVLCPTGHSPIKARMAELGAPLAGDVSGHLFFADRYLGYDDGAYAALRVLALLERQPAATLAARVDALPRSCTGPEIRIACPESDKFALVAAVKRNLEEAGTHFCDVDGVRVGDGRGWWLLRASNTEAALVLRCEAANEEDLSRMRAELAAQLSRIGIRA